MDDWKLNSIDEAIQDIRDGKFVIVVDDEDRENEGDLICAAEKITPEMVNFMLKEARGILCAPITISRCEELDLPIRSTRTCQSALCPGEWCIETKRTYRSGYRPL